ncbi:response regulator [bacterium]|nr:response regulator [bacterium]MBU1072631.1 response regulator [bacterium]MBU1675537.1 response regulator [bacterium]
MSLKILIVDDSITVRAVLRKALRITNLAITEIFEAANGLEAMKILAEQDVDILFTDLVMPEMNGEEFIAKLSRDGLTDRLPVVVISSAGGSPRVERLRELGVRGFVHKPFTPEQIEELVIEHTGAGVR